MDSKNVFQNLPTGLIKDAFDYWFDAYQRSILFMDVLRKRGNTYLEHLEKGQPPVLTFDYKIIVDGRSLKRPVNYDLVQIIPKEGFYIDPNKRPIVIIDPRAGHGPGIGGSKRDSEIGVAIENGHPVYFVLFYTEPVPGQTLADVQEAEVEFVSEVGRRHPKADEPAVIGNCQAGWAVALMSADRPDVTGPLVFNGSPLSYWSGVEGENPMRYLGGLIGGIWMTSLLSDLGNGKFDGANLVSNFESLNPANTLWTKQYNLYSRVDTEEERYLNFEKWWNGFFIMTSEEIHFIVENLFIKNKLEKGVLEMGGKKIDLRNLEDPVVVFASMGDNITPPQQALNWIAQVYETVDQIKRCQQVIVYMVHQDVGHLGIFVSGKVAQKEHKGIIGSIDMTEYLSPGLYEMLIEEGDEKAGVRDYNVKFIERDIADILKMDDGQEDEEGFHIVAEISEINDSLYRAFISPWVRMGVNEFSAEIMHQLHPLRASRYFFSDLNPFMLPFKTLAPFVKENRRIVPKNNTFLSMEKNVSNIVEGMLNYYKAVRDNSQEFLFKMIYGNSFMETLFPKKEEIRKSVCDRSDKENILKFMDQGGFTEGVVRIIIAMAGADRIFDQKEFAIAENIIKADERLKKLKPDVYKQMIKQQSAILEVGKDEALKSLIKLLPTLEDRVKAVEIARKVACADMNVAVEEKALMEKIEKALELVPQHTDSCGASA